MKISDKLLIFIDRIYSVLRKKQYDRIIRNSHRIQEEEFSQFIKMYRPDVSHVQGNLSRH